MRIRQQFAMLIRRAPILMRIPYYLYRLIQPKYSVGVVAVVINEANEILLVEHVFHPRLPWGLPGGWIGFNEAPAKTVKRELKEELGLDVRVDALLLAGKTQFNHLDFAYLCAPLGDVASMSFELLGYSWVKQEELPQLNAFHYQAIMTAVEKKQALE